MRLISHVQAPPPYSLVALGMRLDLAEGVATTLALAVGIAVLLVASVLARRDEDGRRSFALTVVAILLCSPVIWLHYFALLVVAMAVLRPQLGVPWLLPLLLRPLPRDDLHADALASRHCSSSAPLSPSLCRVARCDGSPAPPCGGEPGR